MQHAPLIFSNFVFEFETNIETYRYAPTKNNYATTNPPG